MNEEIKEVDEEKLRAELEEFLEEKRKAVEKEWFMCQIEKAEAERKAHQRGEYTEADYQKDLALLNAVLARQKQKNR